MQILSYYRPDIARQNVIVQARHSPTKCRAQSYYYSELARHFVRLSQFNLVYVRSFMTPQCDLMNVKNCSTIAVQNPRGIVLYVSNMLKQYPSLKFVVLICHFSFADLLLFIITIPIYSQAYRSLLFCIIAIKHNFHRSCYNYYNHCKQV